MRIQKALAAAALAALGLLSARPAAARSVTIAPGPEGADSAPYQFFPALPRGATHDTLYAFSDPGGHSFETFLRFDLPPDLLGPDEEVAEAYLTLFHSIDDFGLAPDDPVGPGTLECRETLQAWDEATLIWNNKPSYGPPVDTITGIEELGYLTCDVTGLVADWAEEIRPNHGFALTSPTQRILGFYSFERLGNPALLATLFIDVQPVPEPTAGTATLAAGLALTWMTRRAREGRAGA